MITTAKWGVAPAAILMMVFGAGCASQAAVPAAPVATPVAPVATPAVSVLPQASPDVSGDVQSSPSEASASPVNTKFLVVASRVADRKCSVSAESKLLHSGSSALRDAAIENPASLALAPGKAVVTEARAIGEASDRRLRQQSTVAPGTQVVPEAAISTVPFSEAMTFFESSAVPDGFVAPNRCVYVITVHARIAVDHALPGVDVSGMVYDSYLVMIDVASGEQLGLAMGPGTPDVITGEHVPSTLRR